MPTWNDLIQANPQHSANYAQRWVDIAASGQDIFGEARLVDALASRGARILDAGCGQGRLGGYLLEQGHSVTGVDLDPHLISVAEQQHPKGKWFVHDLGVDDIASTTNTEFDIAFCAGNVITFIEPERRQVAIENIARALKPGGRFLLGFGAGRGYPFGLAKEHLVAAGFQIDASFSSWDLQPEHPDAQFIVLLGTKRVVSTPRACIVSNTIGLRAVSYKPVCF